MQVVPIRLDLVEQISSVRLLYPSDLRPLDNRMSVLKSINEVEKRFPLGIPLLDPIDDVGIKEREAKELVKVQSMISGYSERSTTWTPIMVQGHSLIRFAANRSSRRTPSELAPAHRALTSELVQGLLGKTRCRGTGEAVQE